MKIISIKSLIIAVILITGTGYLQAQVVGLDNWFNRETKNGVPFHYLWNDTADSGYSRWGEIFKSKGAKITTIEKPTAAVLNKVQIYIIVDPDTTKENPSPNYISADDIKAITKWVKKGGVLMILANDAPNCEFTNLNKLMDNFGMTFDHVTDHPVIGKQWDMGAFTKFGPHPLFNGITKIYMKEIASIKLSGNAKPVLEENNKAYIAEAKVGKGTVFAVGDPWIYNEYIDHSRLTPDFENRKAAENLTAYLIELAKGKKL
jgi:unsaturated rhamnogalacturonyl hydrolase